MGIVELLMIVLLAVGRTEPVRESVVSSGLLRDLEGHLAARPSHLLRRPEGDIYGPIFALRRHLLFLGDSD